MAIMVPRGDPRRLIGRAFHALGEIDAVAGHGVGSA
jgi:hypothetical protein